MTTRWNPGRHLGWRTEKAWDEYYRATQGVGLRRTGERGEGAGEEKYAPCPLPLLPFSLVPIPSVRTNQNGGWAVWVNLSVTHQKRLFCRLVIQLYFCSRKGAKQLILYHTLRRLFSFRASTYCGPPAPTLFFSCSFSPCSRSTTRRMAAITRSRSSTDWPPMPVPRLFCRWGGYKVRFRWLPSQVWKPGKMSSSKWGRTIVVQTPSHFTRKNTGGFD